MKFTDLKQREWTLAVNVAVMRRAKAKGIDLSMPVTQLQQFVMDDVFIADALWAILAPEAKERGITSDQFDEGLGGSVFETAREALWKAMEAYYDPKSQRAEILRAALAEVKLQMATAMGTLAGSTAPKVSSATT